jgi:predicted O-linked N-acetylglucosamine transferase (SPINDLY family)
MAAGLEDALRKYKAGEFKTLIRDHGDSVSSRKGVDQNLLVILAQSHLKTGDPREAARHFRMAGENPGGTNHLAYLLIAGSLYLKHGMIGAGYETGSLARKIAPTSSQALELYYRALRQTCLFDEIETENHILKQKLRAGDALFLAADNPFSNISWCADEAINASIRPANTKTPVTSAMQVERRARPHRWGEKIRIGYLSDDFYDQHPVMHLFQGVMVSHDAERFEVTYFCYTSAENIAKDRGKRAHYPNLVPIGHLEDNEAADFIRARGIDILVDLKGHTQGCRPNLVNLGLAPIHAAYLGYPGSGNGIDCDYVISDTIVTPDTSRPFYHEKLCRLPESYQANDTLFRARPQPASRQDVGLPADRFVFAFFNAIRKLTPETFHLTMEILKGAPESVLWILFVNDFARQNFLAAATRAGVAPDRIIAAPPASYRDHIARLAAADLGLDTFPYNGHTTTSDALWAGLPVVSAKGSHFASRVSESLLTALGLPELVAETPADYVDLALGLAGDRARLDDIRSRIAANRDTAPLFHTTRFVRHLERAYEMMVERARGGRAPDHIDVPALPRT